MGAGPVALAALCGAAPIPFGYASAGGQLVALEDGRWCFPSPPEGAPRFHPPVVVPPEVSNPELPEWTPARGGPELRGRAVLERPGPPEEAWLFAQSMSTAAGAANRYEAAYVFQKVTVPGPFSIRLPEGKLYTFWLRSPRLASNRLRLPVGGGPLEVVMGPWGSVEGRAPPRSAVQAGTYFDDVGWSDGAYAGSDGRYRLTHLRPGFWRIGPSRWVWVKAGRTARVDFADAPRYEPHGPQLWQEKPSERWALPEAGASSLLFPGETDPGREGPRVAVEVRARWSAPSVRLLGRGEGPARISRRVRAKGRPSLRALRRARSLAELHSLLIPRLELYGPDGKLAAAAFAPVSYGEFGLLVRAVERGEPPEPPRAFEAVLDGLPPGRYRVEAHAFGRRLWRESVELGPVNP